MRLSILIPTLVARESMLDRLMIRLLDQKTSEVEILTMPDAGERPTGHKRNALIEHATGDYVAFIDDDDMVACDYVASIFEATSARPDVVGIRGEMDTNGQLDTLRLFEHSIRHRDWFTRKDGVLCRCPNHLNPVRRELAARVAFPSVMRGEDKAWSLAMRPLLASEVMIEHPIYFYHFQSRKVY